MTRYYAHTLNRLPPELVHHYGAALNWWTRPKAEEMFSFVSWYDAQNSMLKEGVWYYPFGTHTFTLSQMLQKIKDYNYWGKDEIGDLAWLVGISSVLERGKRQTNYERLMVLSWNKNLESAAKRPPDEQAMWIAFMVQDLGKREGDGIPAPRTREALAYTVNRFKAKHGLTLTESAKVAKIDPYTGKAVTTAEETAKKEAGRLEIEKKRAKRLAEDLTKYKYTKDKERKYLLIGGGIVLSSLLISLLVKGVKK